ncbi:MAG: response regulator [Caldilinea sp. CFX5]|nr:response regulator [Caldilinea sp. CFX5]
MKRQHPLKLRLLLVEESAEQCAFLEFLLTRAGYTVHAVTSEEEAVATVMRERLHLVLIGESFAAQRRFLLCVRLRRLFRFPIVILAPLLHPDDLATAFRLGADDYIIMPIPPNILLARINSVLRRAHKNTPRHRWNALLSPEVVCPIPQ